MGEEEWPVDALPGSLDHPEPMFESEKDSHLDEEAEAPKLSELEHEQDQQAEYPVVISQDEGQDDVMGPAPEDLP